MTQRALALSFCATLARARVDPVYFCEPLAPAISKRNLNLTLCAALLLLALAFPSLLLLPLLLAARREPLRQRVRLDVEDGVSEHLVLVCPKLQPKGLGGEVTAHARHPAGSRAGSQPRAHSSTRQRTSSMRAAVLSRRFGRPQTTARASCRRWCETCAAPAARHRVRCVTVLLAVHGVPSLTV